MTSNDTQHQVVVIVRISLCNVQLKKPGTKEQPRFYDPICIQYRDSPPMLLGARPLAALRGGEVVAGSGRCRASGVRILWSELGPRKRYVHFVIIH